MGELFVNLNELIVHPQIIPTALIPLTVLSVALSALATLVASLFGVHLKAEGPKKLLEVLFKPKILISAIILNLLIIGSLKVINYTKNLPSFELTIKRKQTNYAKSSDYSYSESLQHTPLPILKTKPAPKKMKVIEVATKQLDHGSVRGAVVVGDRFFVGMHDGYVREFHAQSFELFRTFYIGTAVTPAPVIYKNKLYVGEGTHDTHHARIYKFDLKTGHYENSHETLGHTEGQPVIGKHQDHALLFAVAGSDGVVAIHPDTMEKVWHQIPGHVDAAVRIQAGRVFAGSGREKHDGTSYRAFASAYHFETGEELWQRELPASSWMQPLTFKNRVCFVFGEVYFKSNVGGFACFDQKTGESRTSYMHFNPVVAVPILVENDIILSDLMGNICRVSAFNAKVKWCQKTHEHKFSLANVMYDLNHHVLVYPSHKNGIYVLDPKDGRIITKWKPKKEEWLATVAPVAFSKFGWIVIDRKKNMRLLKPVNLLSAKLNRH